MIDLRQDRCAARQFWSGTVRQIFQTLEIDRQVSADDVAESLAVFCEDRPQISCQTLSLLMARSLCAAGNRCAAERVLCHDRTHRPHAGSWLDVLSAEYPFPELYPLFASRALRPMQLTSAGALWVLDFGRICLTKDDGFELILFQTVRVLAEKISNVWKRSGGCGVLGIKHLRRPANLLGGRQASRRLHDHLCDVLENCARMNNWKAVPSVLLLDL